MVNATTACQKKSWGTHRFCRPSFTLVELMVAIAIIGVLAGMVLYTLAGAQRDALTIRTQGTIKKLNDIILTRWEEFRYRSVKLNIPASFIKPYQTTGGWQVAIAPREGARARMIALRDTMRMEMPDRYSDLLYPPVIYKIAAYTADNYMTPPGNRTDELVMGVDRDVPGRYQSYRRSMVVEPSGGSPLPLTVNPYPFSAPVVPVGSLVPSLANQSAELLYEIVANSTYQGGSALEHFRPSEIGDTDGDGFNEFLDAWGRPIYWIRWPAGVVSPLNDTLTPDPMDPLKTDWRWGGSGQKPWMLVPLIVSAGPDASFDLIFDFVGTTPVVDPSAPMGSVQYAQTYWTGATDPAGGSNVRSTGSPYYFPDPYVTINSLQLGAPYDLDSDGQDGSADNISNYELVLQ